MILKSIFDSSPNFKGDIRYILRTSATIPRILWDKQVRYIIPKDGSNLKASKWFATLNFICLPSININLSDIPYYDWNRTRSSNAKFRLTRTEQFVVIAIVIIGVYDPRHLKWHNQYKEPFLVGMERYHSSSSRVVLYPRALYSFCRYKQSTGEIAPLSTVNAHGILQANDNLLGPVASCYTCFGSGYFPVPTTVTNSLDYYLNAPFTQDPKTKYHGFRTIKVEGFEDFLTEKGAALIVGNIKGNLMAKGVVPVCPIISGEQDEETFLIKLTEQDDPFAGKKVIIEKSDNQCKSITVSSKKTTCVVPADCANHAFTDRRLW